MVHHHMWFYFNIEIKLNKIQLNPGEVDSKMVAVLVSELRGVPCVTPVWHNRLPPVNPAVRNGYLTPERVREAKAARERWVPPLHKDGSEKSGVSNTLLPKRPGKG